MIEKLKKWYLGASIFKKVCMLNFIVILLPILFLGGLSTYISSNILISETRASSIRNLKLISKNLDNLITNAERIADIIIPYPEVQKSMKTPYTNTKAKWEKEQYLGTILDNIIGYGEIVSTGIVLGENGLKVVSGSINEKELGIFFQENTEEKYNEIIRSKSARWYGLHRYSYNKLGKGRNGILYKKDIIDGETGGKKGVLLLNVDEESISKTYDGIEYGETGRFFILNKDGEVVSSKIKSNLYKGMIDEEYVKWALDAYEAGEIFDLNGKKNLVTVVRYKKLDWFVIGVVPLEELLGKQELVKLLMLLVVLILAGLTLGMVVLATKVITDPITRLSKNMEMIGKVGVGQELDELRKDEVGQLTRSYNKMTREIENLLKINFEQNKKQREYEFIALQAQINPHFLYNTLESICSLILMKDNERAYKMTNSLSNYYRTSLSKGERIITIEEEILNIESYLIIQKIRYGDKIDYEIDIPEEILKKKIIKLSIQPLVENSIYHGIKLKSGRGRIIIQGRVEEEKICISVIDDGVGMANDVIEGIFIESKKGKKSFGVKSVDERIRLVFGEEYGLAIESELELGTKVAINIPLDYKIGIGGYE